jgi:hypothetical protein
MTPSGSQLSIQESLFPDLTCFGCGHANPDGFHLRSYRDGDRAADFRNSPLSITEIPQLIAGVG